MENGTNLISNQTWVIADTNYFLHFQYPDQIDWNALVSSKQIILVVPVTVIDELDKHKNASSAKLRSRAKSTIAKLRDVSRTDTKMWGQDIRVEIAPNIPLVDMKDLGLDEGRADDRIIAFAISFAKNRETESSRVFVVSNDFGMELKSKGRGIRLLALPDDLALAGELDPLEKELRDLKKQNAALTSRIPNLSVTMNESGSRFDTTLSPVPNLTDDEIELRVAEVKKLNPLHVEAPITVDVKDKEVSSQYNIDLQKISAAVSALQGLGRPSKEQWEQYNSKLEHFYREYRDYLRQEQAHKELVGRSIFLNLDIENAGTTPASDVRVILHFPDGFQLIEYEDFPEAPNAPLAPREPRLHSLAEMISMNHLMQSGLSRPIPGLSSLEINREPPNVSGFSIKPTNSFEVKFNVRKVMHGDPIFLRCLVVIFDSAAEAHSFAIDSKIICDELPEPSHSQLHVIVNRQ